MSVIAEFRVPASDFELGRILSVEGGSTIELETLVPLGGSTVPLFWVHNSTRTLFLDAVRDHAPVADAAEVDSFDDRSLFTLDWNADQDSLVAAIRNTDGRILSAVGTADTWRVEARFSTRDELSAFAERCEEAGIRLETDRIYNPTTGDAGPWYGLTEPQREALLLATRRGYYDIPRECTTLEVAEELGISDQAVTERLRRAIATFVTHAFLDQVDGPGEGSGSDRGMAVTDDVEDG